MGSEESNTYMKLCQLVMTTPFEKGIDVSSFSTSEIFETKPFNERFTNALWVLFSMMLEEETKIEKLDSVLIDKLINRLDEVISSQLNEILHHDAFQGLESLWEGLSFLVNKSEMNSNTSIHLLDLDKKTLSEDFNDSLGLTESGLYQHIYVSEYDMPGGEPYSAMISGYEFDSGHQDIRLLSDIASVSASAHCPFIGNVGGSFFNKKQIDDITRINDLHHYMESADYIKWNALRKKDEARYIGLVLPKFILRLPYAEVYDNKGFQYYEETNEKECQEYLWGAGSFAFASNLCRSFNHHGWCVNIIGAESGGKVDGLLVPTEDLGCGRIKTMPTETLLSETKELALAELGFIPLSYYKHSDFACFFSANSIQQPQQYSDYESDANARINARLPYILLTSRLAHYLKVLQREHIGSNKTRRTIETTLNEWLKGLITKMNDPSPEVAATHPLREGNIDVVSIPGKPGFYKVNLSVMPHFQIEGIDVRLSLQSEIPGSDKEY